MAKPWPLKPRTNQPSRCGIWPANEKGPFLLGAHVQCYSAPTVKPWPPLMANPFDFGTCPPEKKRQRLTDRLCKLYSQPSLQQPSRRMVERSQQFRENRRMISVRYFKWFYGMYRTERKSLPGIRNMRSVSYRSALMVSF